jgi:hypothetical protein
VKRANKNLETADLPPLPDKLNERTQLVALVERDDWANIGQRAVSAESVTA